MTNWIKCTDQLPKPFQMVILLENDRSSICGFITESGSFYEPVLIDFETERLELNPIGPGRINAWQPLPQPPIED